MVRSNEPKLTVIVGTEAASACFAPCGEGSSAEWRTAPIVTEAPATDNQIAQRFQEEGRRDAEPGSTLRGVPVESENGLNSEGMPNLLDYYTTMVTRKGVLRPPKVTRLGHASSDPQVQEANQWRMKGKGQEDYIN